MCTRLRGWGYHLVVNDHCTRAVLYCTLILLLSNAVTNVPRRGHHYSKYYDTSSAWLMTGVGNRPLWTLLRR